MFEESVDLRYEGQSSTLNLPWNKDLITLVKSFHAAHQKQFGHAVELVTVRLRAELCSELPDFSVHFPSQPGQPHTFMNVAGEQNPVHVYARKNFALKQTLEGPAIITESVSTTWLASVWRAINDTVGNLLLRASNAPE
jgi:N-methylhydantoinase A